ncbi:MAG TPA: alpha/beta hydrolase [Trebonia sp.]|nr:alpha/beta hydrolase [Trebonia sp.]
MTGQPPPSWFTRALAAPADDRTVAVAGAGVCYRAWGQAGRPGAVLVHGTAAHARWWDHIGPLLEADGLRVAALSMSGHGDSDWRDLYSLDQWAAEVMAVAADAGIAGPPFIIGHSLGGSVAIRTAAHYGADLAGIVVIDSPVYEGPPPPEMSTPEMGFGTGRTYPSREAILARFRLVPEQPVLPYVREHVAAWSVTARDGGQWGWKFDHSLFAKMTGPPSPAERARCQVAVLRAEHGLMSAGMAGRLASRLGGPVPIAELPAAGHHVMLDEPLSLVAALRTLLASWTVTEPGDLAVPQVATEG